MDEKMKFQWSMLEGGWLVYSCSVSVVALVTLRYIRPTFVILLLCNDVDFARAKNNLRLSNNNLFVSPHLFSFFVPL